MVLICIFLMTNNIKHLLTCWFVICVSLWLAVQGFCPLQKLQIISCSSVTLPAFCVVSVLDFGHFNWYVVVSHWFSLDFPDDIWCGASFHMLICHLYIFFCPFKNWVVLFYYCGILRVLHIFWIKSFVKYLICKYFLPICALSFYSLNNIFKRAEV